MEKIDCHCFTANVTNLIYIVSYIGNAKCIVSAGKKGNESIYEASRNEEESSSCE